MRYHTWASGLLSFRWHDTANHLVLVPETALPAPQGLQLHGTQAFDVVIAVHDLRRRQRKGPRALAARKGVHAVRPIELLACGTFSLGFYVF